MLSGIKSGGNKKVQSVCVLICVLICVLTCVLMLSGIKSGGNMKVQSVRMCPTPLAVYVSLSVYVIFCVVSARVYSTLLALSCPRVCILLFWLCRVRACVFYSFGSVVSARVYSTLLAQVWRQQEGFVHVCLLSYFVPVSVCVLSIRFRLYVYMSMHKHQIVCVHEHAYACLIYAHATLAM
jgi:hypothetical protein